MTGGKSSNIKKQELFIYSDLHHLLTLQSQKSDLHHEYTNVLKSDVGGGKVPNWWAKP